MEIAELIISVVSMLGTIISAFFAIKATGEVKSLKMQIRSKNNAGLIVGSNEGDVNVRK